jgi:N-acyl-D-aspartate/D-glutamate deacylase
MARYLLFAFSDCKDPAREAEFNDWYTNVHLPDMLEVPGMIRATRWMSADNKENEIRKYLAMYELETDDLAKFNDGVRERGMRTVREGRFSDLPVFDPPNVPRIYRQIMDEKRPSPAKD